MSRANPHLSSFLKQSVFKPDHILNYRDNNIRFAFAVEGYLDQELKDDSRFVKGIARLWGMKEGKAYEKIFPYRKCREEDLAEFAPPAPEA